MNNRIAICDKDILYAMDLIEFFERVAARCYMNISFDLFESENALYSALSDDLIKKPDIYDLIIMDIDSCNLGNYGIKNADIILKIRDELKISTPILFISVSDEYALKKGKLQNSEFFCKPLTITDIKSVIERHYSKHMMNEHIFEYRKLNSLETNTVKLRTVMYFVRNQKVLDMHLESGEIITIHTTLDEVYSDLRKCHFCYCNDVTIVNMFYVRTFPDRVILKNEEVLPLSKNCLIQFVEAYDKITIPKTRPIRGVLYSDGTRIRN